MATARPLSAVGLEVATNGAGKDRQHLRGGGIRHAGPKAYITVKSARAGVSRAEFEYEVPVDHADAMLETLCAKPLLEKTRHRGRHAGLTWEIDVYTGPTQGLVLAEIELTSEGQALELPPWAGAEVTDDPRYRNSSIAKNGAP